MVDKSKTQSTPVNEHVVEQLLAPFEKQNADGTYVYSDSEVRHLLPMILLCSNADFKPEDVPARVSEFIGEFAWRIGIGLGQKPAEVSALVEAYYEENPVNETLLKAFARALRKELSEATGSASGRKQAEKFLAQPAQKTKSKPAKDGIKAGPMARFEIEKKGQKKDKPVSKSKHKRKPGR